MTTLHYKVKDQYGSHGGTLKPDLENDRWAALLLLLRDQDGYIRRIRIYGAKGHHVDWTLDK